MTLWTFEKREEGLLPIPRKPIFCPICNGHLVLHNFIATYTKQYDFYHCDIHCKCIECGYYCIFGIPIDESLCNELSKSKYHAKILKNEVLEIYNENNIKKELKKRLEKLGYW